MRTPEFSTVRALGRAAAAALLLPAILRRSGARQGRAAAGGRELESVSRVADELARSADVERVARTLLDELASLFGVGFVALTFVSDDAREAAGYLARADGEDVDWWRDLHLDLGREPSGIASAVFEATALTVYDTQSSGVISRRLAEAVGAKSAAFVPLLVQERVIAVISVATLDEPRVFSNEELAVMQTLASEAAVALERLRAGVALEEALKRERLLASIARRLRSELDLSVALAGAAEETGRALGVSRCIVRIGELPQHLRTGAEWHEPALDPVGEETPELELLERAAEERRLVTGTVAERPTAAAPVIAFERQAGSVTLQRPVAGRAWSKSDLALLEGVAAEIGLALRLARLLEENEERLAQQSALLRAAHVLSSELDLPVVLQRLADQLARLLDAEAADCYLLDRDRDAFRCVAVHGFDRSLLGFEFPADQGLAGAAVREGRPLIESEYGEIASPVPHPAYEGFTDVITAPMIWSDDVRGVLGVGRREGRCFEERDANVLEAFAGLASLALRNAEMFTQRARQARIQRGFYRIASVLGQSLSRSATLEAIAQAAAEALGGNSAAVLVPSSGRLEAVGTHELPADLARPLAERAAERQGPLFRAAAEGRILVSSSISDDERLLPDLREAAASSGYRSLISVPVDAPREAGRGLVLIFFSDERSFSDDDLELARHLADATRGALERSELFEAERGARALAQQLTRTGRLLTSELDPAAVLDEVVQQAPALVNAEAAAFRLLDGEELVVTAAEGTGATEALGSRSPAGAWLSGDVLQSGGPVALPRAGEDERLRGLDPMLGAGHTAFLGVPVGGAEGAPVGVLAVYASLAREWREEEIEALLAVAASTSAALSNAELYQRVALERERSVAILANIAEGIVAVDRDGKVVLWNSAAEVITGVPAPAALGRTPVELLQRSLEAPDGARGERLVPIMRGREEVFLSVTEAVMRDPLGAVAGRIFAFRDISGDRLVEQVKSDFVSTVSHELRTPLTSIYGFAETLLRQDVMFGEEERLTFLRYIASESQRLTSIVDTLLNVARLDTGDLQVNLAETDVRNVVGQVLDTVSAAESNGHRFVVDLPEGPLAAKADPEKLRQVCAILVDNALRYSPEGGTVTVGATLRQDKVEVSVADEGIGIPQADQEQIFRKFYRGADAELRVGAGGTGLGLFIARGLVTAMGGRIWVSSREGEGSRFVFELPAAAASERRAVETVSE
ncbi:MAG: GAF domain-containing protein [Gaiellaceae bacterium]